MRHLIAALAATGMVLAIVGCSASTEPSADLDKQMRAAHDQPASGHGTAHSGPARPKHPGGQTQGGAAGQSAPAPGAGQGGG